MRLPRRAIPVEVKCRVVLRQLGELWIDDALAPHRGKLGAFLDQMLGQLAFLLGCEIEELRLDHNPALAVREQIKDRDGVMLRYVPDEHDPEHLIYRTAHEHHIKTNVRGDGAQHPDRVLIKRERRRERPKERCTRCLANWRKHGHLCGRCYKVAVKHQRRKMRSANRWPPKGSQKLRSRSSWPKR